MKIVQEISLISVGSFEESSDWSIIRTEIREAISLIVHPPDTSSFTINPTKHGNGVKPIKDACMIALRGRFSWSLETSIHYATRSPGKVDATKFLITIFLRLSGRQGISPQVIEQSIRWFSDCYGVFFWVLLWYSQVENFIPI